MKGRLRLLAALAAVTVAGAGPAAACAICLSAISVSLAEEIDATDRAVLAVPHDDGFRVLAVLKGGGAGEVTPTASPSRRG